MPGTPEEYLRFVEAVRRGEIVEPAGMIWEDGTVVTDGDHRDILALLTYAVRFHRDKKGQIAQRKAMKLLRSLLTPFQLEQLRRVKMFIVVARSGNAYRIEPRFGRTEQVTRHGKRWFARWRFCIHDEQDDDRMPNADLSIAHMVMLLADEDEFLRVANSRDARDQLWNGTYLRRLRQRIAQ